MPPKGLFVRDFNRKIDVLVEAMYDLDRIADASRPLLADLAGIPRPTLKSACISGRASEDLSEKLSSTCAVNLDVTSWVDTALSEDARKQSTHSYAGKDTVEAFRVHVRQSLGLPVFGKRTFQTIASEMLDSDIASIAAGDSGQHAEALEPMAVFLEVDFTPAHHSSGYAYGFRKVRIKISLPESQSVRAAGRYDDQPVQIKGARLELRGTHLNPFWELSVPTKVLDGRYATTQTPLCCIEGSQIDAEITVELMAQLYDGSLIRADNVEFLPDHRSAIIERLLAKRLAGDSVDETGLLRLGKQVLRIIRAESS